MLRRVNGKLSSGKMGSVYKGKRANCLGLKAQVFKMIKDNLSVKGQNNE